MISELLSHIPYAHIRGDRKESLIDHSDLTGHYFQKLLREENIKDVLYKLLAKIQFNGQFFPPKLITFIITWFEKAIYLHDVGKVNPKFQKDRLHIDNDIANSLDNHYHSLLSSIVYLIEGEQAIKINSSRKEKIVMYNVLFHFSYIISRHHGSLEDLKAYGNKLITLQEELKHQPNYLYGYKNSHLIEELDIQKFVDCTLKEMDTPIPFYLLNKLLFSCMVAADTYATYEFMNCTEVNFNHMDSKKVDSVLKSYMAHPIYKGIEAYMKDKAFFSDVPINALRSELLLEAMEGLKNSDTNINYLEAPTGSGKTNTAIYLGIKQMTLNPNLNKLIYVFPFNTLVSQTEKFMNDVFSKSDIKPNVINAITSPYNENEDDDFDFSKALLDRQTLNYGVTITSHVKLFDILFGTSRESNLSFCHLSNSMIVLDEIQSYNNRIWREIINMLEVIVECFNIKLLIMSATLPYLSAIGTEQSATRLIKNTEKYYQDDLFKGRVKLNFEYLDGKRIDIEKEPERLWSILDNIICKHKNKRILIEFISKKTARIVFDYLKDKYANVYELTGDDSPNYRNTIISKLKAENEDGNFVLQQVVLVATQVIEAGVDIDMDVGVKTISILDAEEQFLGRINRTAKREGIAYFIFVDNINAIYRDDWRTEKNLLNKNYQDMLYKKDFEAMYAVTLNRIMEEQEQQYGSFLEAMKKQSFKDVEEILTLIDSVTYDVYFNYCSNSEELWNTYVKIKNDISLSYPEKKIKLLGIKREMAEYTFSFYESEKKEVQLNKEDGIYKLDNALDYLVRDENTGCYKINREKFEADLIKKLPAKKYKMPAN